MLVVDLSNNNHAPDWHALKRAGVGAVWLKATEGSAFHDPDFRPWRVAANKAGVRVGAYHFARPDKNVHNPAVEAAWFSDTVGSVGRTDLRPVLDYERLSGAGNDEAWIRQWNQAVKKTLGVGPLFYSYLGLIAQLKLARPVGYGLWVAAYGSDDGKEHPVSVPSPWRRYVAHQFTSKGRMAGCDGPVDISRVSSVNAVLAHPVSGRLF